MAGNTVFTPLGQFVVPFSTASADVTPPRHSVVSRSLQILILDVFLIWLSFRLLYLSCGLIELDRRTVVRQYGFAYVLNYESSGSFASG